MRPVTGPDRAADPSSAVLYPGGRADQNGSTISKECDMSTEAVIWSVLGVIAAVGGIGLLASILALIRAPR